MASPRQRDDHLTGENPYLYNIYSIKWMAVVGRIGEEYRRAARSCRVEWYHNATEYDLEECWAQLGITADPRVHQPAPSGLVTTGLDALKQAAREAVRMAS